MCLCTCWSMEVHWEDKWRRFIASIQKSAWLKRKSVIWVCSSLYSSGVAWIMCWAQYWQAYFREPQIFSSTWRLGTSESRRNEEGKLQMLKWRPDFMIWKQECVRRAWWEARSQDISTIWGEVLEGVLKIVNFERAWVKIKSWNDAWYQKTFPSLT